MRYFEVSDKYLASFKKLCDEKGIKYETDAEYRDSARNLLGFVDTLVQIDMEERERKARLKKEPKGFSMAGEGRNCSLCGRVVFDKEEGWYDKWGFKCMNCQDAVNKRIIPGSLCRDYDNKKCITDSDLAWKSGLRVQTIKKLVRQGKIKARQIPHGPYVILRKDNPYILNVIDAERAIRAAKAKS
jgi:hypothetical protein